MKYVKAEVILPDNLVKEIQKYIQGEYLYIPSQVEKRKRWGEKSGSRSLIQERNQDIRSKYLDGYKIKDLAEKYFLSEDSIKKIVYSKNR